MTYWLIVSNSELVSDDVPTVPMLMIPSSSTVVTWTIWSVIEVDPSGERCVFTGDVRDGNGHTRCLPGYERERCQQRILIRDTAWWTGVISAGCRSGSSVCLRIDLSAESDQCLLVHRIDDDLMTRPVVAGQSLVIANIGFRLPFRGRPQNSPRGATAVRGTLPHVANDGRNSGPVCSSELTVQSQFASETHAATE